MLLSWSAADKCMLVGAILLTASTLFALMTAFADGWPYFADDLPDELIERLARESRWVVLGWVALVGTSWLARSRAPDSKLLVHATVQAYSVTTALFTYLTGPFNAAGWIGFIGGAIVGFMLFSPRVIALGIATWFVAIGAIAVLAETDVVPYAPLLRSAGGPEVSTWWLVRNGVVTTVLCALVFPLCGYIITTWKKREAELDALSKTDGLTGVANRRHVIELLEHELRQAHRYGRDLSLVMVDLDHFKRVNDDHGHIVGDRVLVAAVDAIRRSVRDSDVVGRYGGEEFLLLLPNTDEPGAREVAERCRRLIGEARVGTISVTASLGVASYPGAEVDRADDLIHVADEALYRAKESGRDRVALAV
jgi:diguanylate cyclase (GGDEF)-like protein